MHAITWLHLSDLHLKEDEYNRQVVLAALWNDISKRTTRISSDLEKIDFIFFTGDIAYHGKSEEYELAIKDFFQPLLKTANLGSVGNSRLFLVPGNHDINREAVGLGAEAIGESLKERDDINKLLDSKRERELVFERLNNYFDFFGEQFKELRLNELGYFYVAVPPLISGKKVAILGLNSAWLSYGGDEDRGNLVIGERQVNEAIRQSETADIRIALMHHPFDWLQENEDTQSVKFLLQKRCHFILHGHLHKTDIIRISNLAGEAIIIPAGAIYDKRQSPNSYNFVRLSLETGKGYVYLRSYNDKRQEWQKDTFSTGDEMDGQVSFDLPEELLNLTPITVSEDDQATSLRCYLESVVKQYKYWRKMYVELAGQTTEIDEPDERVSLPDFIEPVYVEYIKRSSGQPQQVRLESLFELVDKPYDVMLLGEPGSGKTTALRRIALQIAEGSLQSGSEVRIPILLSLSSLQKDDVEEWVRQGCESLEPYIDGYLQSGKCIFLWDALNEMPFDSKEQYSAKLNALKQFMTDYPANRFIWSCRRLDYQVSLPLNEVEILPLDDEKIRDFFHNLSKSGETEACDALLSELEGREGGFGELFRRPLMLELLWVLYYEAQIADKDEVIPQSPGKLFSEFVDKLMMREQRGEPLPKISPKVQKDALGKLAFSMMDTVQAAEGIKARSGTAVSIDVARQYLPKICYDEHNHPVSINPDELLDVAAGETILEFISKRSQLRFWHQSLQEYFAALELEKRLRAGGDLTRILQPPPDSTGWEETIIMLTGIHPAVEELIRGVLPKNPILAGQCLVKGLDDKTLTRLEGIKTDVIDALVEIVENPGVAFQVRLAAGDVLGCLSGSGIPVQIM